MSFVKCVTVMFSVNMELQVLSRYESLSQVIIVSRFGANKSLRSILNFLNDNLFDVRERRENISGFRYSNPD